MFILLLTFKVISLNQKMLLIINKLKMVVVLLINLVKGPTIKSPVISHINDKQLLLDESVDKLLGLKLSKLFTFYKPDNKGGIIF